MTTPKPSASNAKSSVPKSDVVYRILKRAILDQAFAAGTKLPEDSIGERLGVSRTIVRQALARLNGEGLIELRPNKGACVSHPSLEDGHDIFAVRRALETLVVDSLIGRLTPPKIKELEAHVDAEDKARVSNPSTSIQLAGEFHVLLARLTENATLLRYVTELVSRSSMILSLYGRPHSSDCAVSEHRALIAALARNDHEKACELMGHHIGAITARALLKSNVEDGLPDLLAAYAKEEGL
ncbi:GntR family transcriptional regulator [Sinorhizobium sp. NFACC03]|uniref:GntR family transcriptional regulator n=1 Tax=Sinorhizobium sp. NFACC03 TaxID=1566295 RepID=UPI00088CFA6A|nr:GntR family transcriptional regulator [Sinorhizobium sp. NFACC03]SDA94084.1 transcriptional regulator, GntR family [Sinorhizobium sp. NFACC03]